MRKLVGLMALVSALGLCAASAPAAFAGVASESLPNTAENDWTGVETECNGEPTPLAGCAFVATSTGFVLTNGERKVMNCKWTLEGRIFKDGSTSITAGNVEGNAICEAIELKELPWNDQICEYTGSTPHQYYDRISIDFFVVFGQEIQGPIYLHLLNAEKEDESPLTVRFASARKFLDATKPAEIGTGPWGILADDEKLKTTEAQGSTMYEFGAKPVVKVISTEMPCEWPFEHLDELP